MRFTNVGRRDRLLRLGVGTGLVLVGILHPSVLSDLWLVLGGLLLLTGLSGFCLVYRVLGVATLPGRAGQARPSGNDAPPGVEAWRPVRQGSAGPVGNAPLTGGGDPSGVRPPTAVDTRARTGKRG